MDFKQRYINEEILQGIVIPFYKKHFPNMYDDSLNIVVELFDNVPKDKQKISQIKKILQSIMTQWVKLMILMILVNSI